MNARKVWAGTVPTNCDLCRREIVGNFVDGKTAMGPWACMCLGCASTRGVGLGMGRGQKYKRETSKDVETGARLVHWVKVGG